jgi:protein TonB
MKTFKSMPKECCVSMLNNVQALFIVITALLLISTSSYSKNSIISNSDWTIKQVQTPCLDSIIKKKTTATDVQNTNERLIVKLNELDKLAEFPGGMEKFYEKVIAKLDDSELSYTGFTQIHASFIIEKDGSMSGIVVDSTLNSELKKEIIDGLKSIKAKWSPATLDNKPVRISYSLPIVLNLD